MATEEQHLKKAEHNQRMLDQINDEFPDWQAIVACYRCIHLIEAGFVRVGLPTGKKHHTRNQCLKRFFNPVWAAYKPIWNLSRVCRYDPAAKIDLTRVRRVVNRRMPDLENAINDQMRETTEATKQAKKRYWQWLEKSKSS